MSELLFVGGDLSGIQSFLYNITSKKAAVSLKGRSAYLVNYTRELCNKILTLPAVKAGRNEEVYCSGGKFYLIAEDNNDVRTAIDAVAKQAEQELWQEHKGQLGLAIAYVPFVFTNTEESRVRIDGEEGGIGLLWSKISVLFTNLKTQKFRALLTDHYEEMFNVLPVGGDVKVCAVTGIEDPNCVKLEDIYVLPSVKKQIGLGEDLRNNEHFKTFEEYAKDSYLGVLRMDVDGMGTRIQKGFKDLKDYRAFSHKLSSFFEGENSELRKIQQKQEYKNNLNIIYAGGDDLFVVGRWNAVLDFAADVHEKFIEHTKGEGLTISGGMAIVGSKFPIAKAANMSGEAEDTAKKYNNAPKNAICFLGETVSWTDDQFFHVRTMKDELCYQINDNGLSRGILQKLMLYSDMAQKKQVNYLWHTVYYLTRLMTRCEKNSPARDFVQKLRDGKYNGKGYITDIDQLRLVSLAARWAELETKKNNN